MVSCIIGSGIFRVPGAVAAEVGSVGAVLALWVLGGLIALCGALSLAELAAAFPRTGGMYVFLRDTYGRWAAFAFGWAMLLVMPASYAFVAMVFAEGFTVLVPSLRGEERLVAAASLALLVAINIRPVRVGAIFLNTATWLKVVFLVALSAGAIALAPGRGAMAAPGIDILPASWSGFGLGLILVMFAYDGWQWVPQIAGEVREPTRALPRALGLGVIVVITVYLVANVANLLVLPMS